MFFNLFHPAQRVGSMRTTNEMFQSSITYQSAMKSINLQAATDFGSPIVE